MTREYKDGDWSYLDDEWSRMEAVEPLLYMEREYGFGDAAEGDLTLCRFLFMPPAGSPWAGFTGRICAVLGRAADEGLWHVIFGDGTICCVPESCFRAASYVRKNTAVERDLTGARRLFVPDSRAARHKAEHAERLCTVERLSERYLSDIDMPFTWDVRFADGSKALACDNELFPLTGERLHCVF